jgi:predicted HAD superfamily Cof-like phosphohydrolase
MLGLPETAKNLIMKKTFADRIAAMNAMYKLPAHDSPSLPANVADRLVKFKATLMDEVHEIDEIVTLAKSGGHATDIAVALADLLGDLMVYCRSEALKYGLPLEEVLDIIMDSNESKLDANGNPIYDANGKFLKGPNYWKPEPKIKALLESRGVQKEKE